MRRLRQLLLVTLAFVSTAAFADTEAINRDIAALYVDAVLETAPFDDLLEGPAAPGSGADVTEGSATETARALHLIEAALAYYPSSSDALFLRGYLNRHDQTLTQSVASDYANALVLDTFTAVEPARAAIAYAQLLYRTRQYEDALAVLNELDRDTPEFTREFEADALVVEARAAFAAERFGQADRVLETGQTNYPDDPRFVLLEMEREPVPSFRYRRELERLLAVHGRRAESMQPASGELARSEDRLRTALLRYGLTAPTEREQLWGADRYLEMGGRDPALALVAPQVIGTEEVLRRFTDRDGYARRGVLMQLLQLELPGLRESLTAGAMEWSGDSYVDRDGDGYWEERVRISGGAVTLWDVDEDQNGVPEYSVSFADGEPQSVVDFQEPGTSGGRESVGRTAVRADYERYPYVSRVTEEREDGLTEYTLVPFTLQLPVIAALPADGPDLTTPLVAARGFRGIDLAAVRRGARTITTRGADGRVLEERSVEEGEVVRARIDGDGDGHFDRLVVYRGGLPYSALRDIDGDGYFEVAEAYDRGQIAAVVVDDDDNGTPDVVEYERDDGIREWDLDQDGSIDVREFGILTERVRVEFPFLETGR